MAVTSHRPLRRLARMGLSAVGLCLLLGWLGWLIVDARADGRRAIEERFVTRAELGVGFVDTYVDQLLDREAAQAAAFLGGEVTQEDLDRFAGAFGFEAAVLLDHGGRLLGVVPPKPELLGTDLTGRYEHLRRGVAGERAVSPLVPSAAEGRPVVGFAVPFEGDDGRRRVISGAFAVDRTPLAAFLRGAVPIQGSVSLIVDRDGMVVAGGPEGVTQAGDGAGVTGHELPSITPALADVLPAGRGEGFVELGGVRHRYVTTPVPGTGWTVVFATAEDQLYAPVHSSKLAPWLLLGAFALAGVLVLTMLQRLDRANGRLRQLSNVDPLTQVSNRRQLDHHASRIDRRAERDGTSTAVLLVDIDHFKQVNDTYGHAVGDAVLRAVAGRLRRRLRDGDVIARVGGEEFAIVLPSTDPAQAAVVAERLRAAAAWPVAVDGTELLVTVSIGSAVRSRIDDAMRSADVALYEAKTAGRDRVTAGAEATADDAGPPAAAGKRRSP